MLNELADILENELAKVPVENSSPPVNISNGPHGGPVNGAKKEPLVTWVHKSFQVSSNIDLCHANDNSFTTNVPMPRIL